MKQFAVLFILVCSVVALGQKSAKNDAKGSVSSVIVQEVSGVEKQFVDAADAMPEDKYSFAPSQGEFKGVRTFGEQVKHVAATNNLIAAAVLGEQPPKDAEGESGPEALKSKSEIMKYLRDSYAHAHQAVASLNAKNATASMKNPFGGQRPVTRVGLVVADVVGHSYNHYGQLVEYLRMNGIVPPASRPSK